MVAPKLSQVIQSHENNFTWLRLVLSANVIYYHAFGLTFQAGYVDHLTQLLQPVTTVGGLAVQAFFFLSGLFVTQSYFQDPRFWSFAVKRTLRIWPGLFVCLALTTLIAVWVSRGKDDFQYFLFSDIYKYILQTSVFEFKWTVSGIYKDNPSQVLNGPLHTLPLEAKMYVLLGLTGLIGMIRSAWRVTLAAGLLGAMCFIPGTLDTLPLHLFNADYARAAICMFLAGMGTYGLANRITIRVWQGVALGLSCWVTQDNWHSFFFYATVCWVLLYFGQTSLPWLGRPKQDLSYGIYIYGWPSQQITMALSPSLNPYELTFAALALATFFAFISWRFIEKPAIQLGKEISKSNRFLALSAPLSAQSKSLIRALASLFVLTVSMMFVGEHMRFVPEVPMSARIENYGPTESRAGQAINQKADGQSAIWLQMTEDVSIHTQVVFSNNPLETVVSGKIVTAKVPAVLLAHAGEIKIFWSPEVSTKLNAPTWLFFTS